MSHEVSTITSSAPSASSTTGDRASMAAAIDAAIQLADETDAASAGIVVTGSVSTVGDAMQLLGRT